MNESRKHFRYRVYTDGAYSRDVLIGGWGVVVYDTIKPILSVEDAEKAIIYQASGCIEDHPMQTGELWAGGFALSYLNKNISLLNEGVKICTDSRYLFKGVTEWMHKWQKNGWKKRKDDRWVAIAHQNTWKRIYALNQALTTPNKDMVWKKIKGHRKQPSDFFSIDVEGNNKADSLCVAAKEAKKLERVQKLSDKTGLTIQAAFRDSSQPDIEPVAAITTL